MNKRSVSHNLLVAVWAASILFILLTGEDKALTRKQFAWSFEEHITQLFTLLDEQTISEALMAVKA